MEALAKLLIEITAYSAALFIAIVLFQRLLGSLLPVRVRYWIWGLLILRLILPITFESGVHPIRFEKEATAQTILAGSESVVGESPAYVTDRQVALPQDEESIVHKTRLAMPNIYTLAVAIWLSGCAVMLIRLALLRWRAIQRLKTNAVPTSEAEILLFDRCKQITGVKADIVLMSQRNLSSPALTLSFHPTLIIPEGWDDDVCLEYAMRHELTHYVRNDHWAGMLLSLLRCVYWFNPLIWVAANRIEIDMEAACDAQATKVMCANQKKQYVQTIIDLACGNVPCALNMSNRRGIEQRIRGVFMNTKTKKYVYIITLMFITVLLAGCFTTLLEPQTTYVEAEEQSVINMKIDAEAAGANQEIMPVSAAVSESEMDRYRPKVLSEGFEAPRAELIDYERMKSSIDNWAELVNADISGSPLHILFYERNDITPKDYFDVGIGGDTETDCTCWLYIDAETGEIISWYGNANHIREFDGFDNVGSVVDKQKVADAGLAYCKKAYPDRKIVAYYTDGIIGSYDKDTLKNYVLVADLWVIFEDGAHMYVSAEIPGYTIYRASWNTIDIPKKGDIERIFGNTTEIWMDER